MSRMSPDSTAARTGVTRSRLRIIYRSHGGENTKDRPPYYSKLLGLASVARAVEESGQSPAPQVIFWNDGPIPADRLELMRSCGDVVQIQGGSNRASYRAAIEMATRSDWSADDLVWFAEDDYLYRPKAFRLLMEAVERIPQADYLSMFGGKALDLASRRSAPRALPRLGAVDTDDPIEVDGLRWYRGVSTTSTFGVRLGALRQDRRLLRALPYTGGSWDHTTCVSVQGLQPFSWSEIGAELLPFAHRPTKQWPSSIALGALGAAANLRSHRSEGNRRQLFLSEPISAMHMEVPTPFDWEEFARQTRTWALARGIPVGDASSTVSG
jgi:hypothetical protein